MGREAEVLSGFTAVRTPYATMDPRVWQVARVQECIINADLGPSFCPCPEFTGGNLRLSVCVLLKVIQSRRGGGSI